MAHIIKKILKNDNSHSLIGNLIFAVSQSLAVIILARSYSQEIFAEWMLFLEGINLLDMIRQGININTLIKFLVGENDKDEINKLIGTNWIISIVVTILLSVIIYLAYIIFNNYLITSGFKLFFLWSPLFLVISLPIINALAILQARKQFITYFFYRLLNRGLFVVFLIFNLFSRKLPIEYVILIYIAIAAFVSIISLFTSVSGIQYIFKYCKDTAKKLINFAKYSVGSFIGYNLFRSSDVFIIGAIMTKPDVAAYSIALKLMDILNIPLNGFAMVAYPIISNASNQGDNNLVRQIFYKYSGYVTILLFPFLLLLFIFSQFFVFIIGGPQYIETNTTTIIFQVFVVYGLFMSIDRFASITLDGINKPEYNFYKALSFMIFNIIGDIVVIYIFKSIIAVSLITIGCGIIQVVISIILLKKEINIRFKDIFSNISIKQIFKFLTSGYK